MSIGAIVRRMRQFWRWAWSPASGNKTICPVCRQPIEVENFTGGSPAYGIPVLRTVGELVTTCEEQNGVEHAQADVDAAKQERLWR